MDNFKRSLLQLVTRYPFFARLSIGRVEESYKVPTAATDGRRILYNPDFVNGLTKEESLGLLVHEVLHIAHKHAIRRKHRDPYIFNVACDYVINLEIVKNNLKLPDGGFLDKRFENMSAEKVYDILIKEGFKAPESFTCDVIFVDGSGEEAEKIDQEISKALVSAANVAKMSSKELSSSEKRLVDTAVRGKISWEAYLSSFLTKISNTDYSWRTPNRRYFGQNFYIPSLRNEVLGDVLFAVDSSGSINEEVLSKVVANLNNFNAQYKTTFEVVCCDTEVQNVQRFEPGDPIKIDIKGGGGTRFSPVMDYVGKMIEKPVVMIYFTDGYCDDFGEDPEIPVLWMLDNEHVTFKPPFGEVVIIQEQ